MPNGLLNITDAEWDQAEQYFRENPTEIKMRKSDAGSQRSFIKVENEIYAMESGTYLGEGAFGKVKIVQNRKGENSAVKIEGADLRSEDNTELKVMRLMGYFKGQAFRMLDRAKPFLKNNPNKTTNKKLYTVTELREGDELFNRLYVKKSAPQVNEDDAFFNSLYLGITEQYQHSDSLNAVQKLLVGLKSCDATQQLHDRHVIHCDIKPENFMLNQNEDMIVVSSIDFGFSMILKEPKNEIKLNYSKGSPFYMAPEILFRNPATYSFASDVYALGRMFQEDLRLSPEIYRPMLERNRHKRINLDSTILNIASTIETHPDITDSIKEQVTPIKEKAQASLLQRTFNTDPQKLYALFSQSSSDGGSLKWLYNKSKAMGKTISGKGKTREDQIQSITNLLDRLKKNSDLQPLHKAEILYALLNNIQQQITTNERNVFTSGMDKMCASMMSDLTLVYPTLNNFKNNVPLLNERLQEGMPRASVTQTILPKKSI